MSIDFGILNQVSPTMQAAQAAEGSITRMIERAQREREFRAQMAQQSRTSDIAQQRADTEATQVAQQGDIAQQQLAEQARQADLENQLGQRRAATEEQQVAQQGAFQQGQLANAAEGNQIERMYREGQLAGDQAALDLKQQQLQNKEMMQQAMRDAAQKGLPAIKQLLLEQGNIKDAMEIDKTQSTIEKNYLAGQKSLLEIQDANEQRTAAQKAGWLLPQVQSITGMEDGPERQQRIMEVARASDEKYGTNFIESGASPDNILTGLVTTVAANQKDLVKAVKTLGPAAEPLLTGYFGKEVAGERLGGSGTTVNIDQRTQGKLLEPAIEKIKAADTTIAAQNKRVGLLDQTVDLMKDHLAKGLPIGAFDKVTGPLAQFTDSLGLTQGRSAPRQALQNIKAQAALSLRVAGTGSMSDKEQEWYMSATPGTEWTLPAAERVRDFEKLNAQRAEEQRDFLVNWVSVNGTDAGAGKAWKEFVDSKPVVNKDGSINWDNVSGSDSFVREYKATAGERQAATIQAPQAIERTAAPTIDPNSLTDAQLDELRRIKAERQQRGVWSR